jgi:hypothetical protein
VKKTGEKIRSRVMGRCSEYDEREIREKKGGSRKEK